MAIDDFPDQSPGSSIQGSSAFEQGSGPQRTVLNSSSRHDLARERLLTIARGQKEGSSGMYFDCKLPLELFLQVMSHAVSLIPSNLLFELMWHNVDA